MGKEKDDKNKIEIVSAGAEPGTGGGPVKREESREQQRNEQYNQYVEQVTPKANCLLNCVKAFITGGCICTVGQMLTGLNIYPLITTWGGAGSLVPITGFANSVVAPAIEYKKEGQVFGIGCKIFTISGPVILYGILSSWILGVIYLIVVSLRAV